VYTSLVELSKPRSVTDLYCFSYNPKGDMMQSTGWYFHDLRAEFQRQVSFKNKAGGLIRTTSEMGLLNI
jgi:hypothetical protein